MAAFCSYDMIQPIDLNTNGVCIRCYTHNDVFTIASYANNERIASQLRDHFPHPYTVADAARWIDGVISKYPQTQFALATADEAIGGIGLELQHDIYRQGAEIGYWLGECFWGKGIMSRAVTAFCDFAFGFFPLIRIYARVFDTNLASARILQKSGFKLEGRLNRSVLKNGCVFDELLYAKIRDEGSK